MTSTTTKQSVIDTQILAVIAAAIGGDGKARLKEVDIRQHVNISHGAFIVARKRMVDAGKMYYTPQGGSLPPIYSLPGAHKSQAANTPLEPLVTVNEQMPRITGDYASIDDWIGTLTDALGVCIDVDDNGDGDYSVYSHQYAQSDSYTVIDLDDGIMVR